MGHLPLSLGLSPVPAVGSTGWGRTEAGTGGRLGGGPALGLLPPADSPRPEKPQLPPLEKMRVEKPSPAAQPPWATHPGESDSGSNTV